MRNKHSITTLLLSATLIFSACSSESSETATPQVEAKQANGTVIHNVRGYTFQNEKLVNFDYLHYSDAGKVLAVGTGEYPEAAVVRDGVNAVLLPGLIDAHGHVSSLGRAMLQVDLMGITTLEETLEVIKAYADANPSLEMIRGRGWNQERWTNTQFPTAADLDALEIQVPIVLGRVDGHAVWVNSKAIKLAGITDATKDPAGGEIIRDAQGHATGILVDTAENLIVSKIPEPDDATNKKYIRSEAHV